MSFSKYAALVKNLRGVVLFDIEEEGVEDSIKWLVKRFKYRNLGLTPSITSKFKNRLLKYLQGNPFRELVPPVPSISKLISLVQETTSLPVEVAELLIYSSVYVSPGILIGNTYAELVEKISTSTVYTCKDLNINDWKLHLRIADYTILDFYENCVDEVLKVIETGDYNELLNILNSRKSRIERDKKRYWRILCDKGRPFLHYVDNLEVFIKSRTTELELEYAAGLAIIPVIRIPKGLK